MKKYNKILEAINKGVQLALDDYDDIPISHKNGWYKEQISTKNYMDLMDLVVDLNLPSGTLWCKYNLGCDFNLLNGQSKKSKAKDWYGNYYAWGEIEPKKKYNWKTYKWCKSVDNLTKYCTNERLGNVDGIKSLQLKDDVAYQNMHIGNFKFKIPTKEQFEELMEYTTSEWTESYQSIIGLNGRVFISIRNNSQMFIPAAGGMGSDLRDAGKEAYLWSSSLYAKNPHRAESLYFIYRCIHMYSDDRCDGFPVRPVINLN